MVVGRRLQGGRLRNHYSGTGKIHEPSTPNITEEDFTGYWRPYQCPVEPAAPSSVAYPYYDHTQGAGSHQLAHEGNDRAIRGSRGDRSRVRYRDVWAG